MKISLYWTGQTGVIEYDNKSSLLSAKPAIQGVDYDTLSFSEESGWYKKILAGKNYELTTEEKTAIKEYCKNNSEAISKPDEVVRTVSQNIPEAGQEIACENIGALSKKGGRIKSIVLTGDTIRYEPKEIVQALHVIGGADYSNSPCLVLKPNNSVDEYARGMFFLTAKDEKNQTTLAGNSTGSLIWNGYEIERIVKNGQGYNGYIRYDSGLQICWGDHYEDVLFSGSKNFAVGGMSQEIIYPVPFSTMPITTISAKGSTASCWVSSFAGSPLKLSNFSFCRTSAIEKPVRTYFAYISIGRWK